MERGLNFFIGMVHKKALPVRRDVKRYSNSRCAGLEQMLSLSDYDFRSFHRYWADEVIICDVLVEEFLSILTPRKLPAFSETLHLPLPSGKVVR